MNSIKAGILELKEIVDQQSIRLSDLGARVRLMERQIEDLNNCIQQLKQRKLGKGFCE